MDGVIKSTFGYVYNELDSLIQHSGYVILGVICVLCNALVLMKFFMEAKNQALGQRPLLLAMIIADILNGMIFIGMGSVQLTTQNQSNATLSLGVVSTLWQSCMETFYLPAFMFIQSMMTLIAFCTSIDRLLAIATPIFYAQCVKPRHCYVVLLFAVTVCSITLFAAKSTAIGGFNATSISMNQWSPSACIAPFPDDQFARYYYVISCCLIATAISFDVLGLISYRRMARQRATYESNTRDPGTENYLPRIAFAPNVRQLGENADTMDRSRPSLDLTNFGGSNCVFAAMIATMLNLSFLFFIPCMFFAFVSGIFNKKNAEEEFSSGGHMAAYVIWGLLFYSIINSFIFFTIRKDIRRGLKRVVVSMFSRCPCARFKVNGVCETTPVEIIADPMASTASDMSFASLPNRMKKRPSIVPLAYGSMEL